jgi:hypothetical protein
LIDYGQLLEDLGLHDKAIEQFRKVREDEIFPRDPKTQTSTRPPSLAVDSLIFESASLKALERWPEAASRLEEAVRIAKDQRSDALLSDAHNESAWLHMDRLEVDKAVDDFKAAEAACRALIKDDQVIFKLRLFHIRHGLALSDRLKGKARESYDQYEQIVRQLTDLMKNDLTFSPKQRRDLRDRLINSMERRADVFLFASQEPVAGVFGLAAAEAAAPRVAPANSDRSARIQDNYQDAIDLNRNDDLATKVRLLYKKVIARCVAGIDGEEPLPAATNLARHKDLAPIDFEFAEANRTFDTLSANLRADQLLYRMIANDCMAIRAATIDRDADVTERVVDKLRSRTIEYATGCVKLNREKVEMLLLAIEILLKPGVEPDTRKRSSDATRMMAVLGETTKVGSHPELARYFERFQNIAAAHVLATNRAAVAARRSADRQWVTMRPPAPLPESLLLYVRIAPGLALRLTAERTGALPPADQSLIRSPDRSAVSALSKAD